jgi:8-amino-7-oxononanoate synthase
VNARPPPLQPTTASPSAPLDAALAHELALLGASHRLRSTEPYPGPDRAHTLGHAPAPLVTFCSNDYLGLAGHPALAAAIRTALNHAPPGAGASRLVSGETPEHLALEHRLAVFVGRPAALLYPTGYLTNLGVISALVGPDDLIVSDAANHASIIDGCRLSRARIEIYPHADAAAAATALSTPGAFRRRLLVTESIFSMDGDRAPLPALAAAAARSGAVFMVDEAHALGVAGPGGRGLCAAFGIAPDLLVGTLGKALGTLGGFVAGSTTLRNYLINRSRPFIYSTAYSPILAAAGAAAVDLAASPEGDRLRARAAATAARIRDALGKTGPRPPGDDLIIPLVVGSDSDALALSHRLRARSLLVAAIRPPTVPPGTARLRVTASASHTDEDVDRLLAALGEAGP